MSKLENFTPKKRVRKVCSNCGSVDILFDAYAVWNEKLQRFDISQVFEKPVVCEKCEGATSYKDEDIA